MLSAQLSDFSSVKNELYRILDTLKDSGEEVIDLISGNPTQFGLNFPKEILEKAGVKYFNNFKSYRPDPRGNLNSRKSVVDYYREGGGYLNPESVILTPGSSESYFYLFKLLGNPGQEFLTPRPSYPLFEFIAKLSDVTLTSYDLDAKGDWAISLESIKKGINEKTAGLIIISPHNPTGHVCDEKEVLSVIDICRERKLPLIIDEVFREFIFSSKRGPRFINQEAPLIFTLNGISKMLALPQIKLGWIAVSGSDSEAVKQSLERLETIADTFLSTSDLSQWVLPIIFSEGNNFLREYKKMICYRQEKAVSLLQGSGVFEVFPPDGGFYIVLKPKLRKKMGSDEVVLKILSEKKVLLHPGSFYDFESDEFLVISFLQEEKILLEGLTRLISFYETLTRV